MGRLKDKIALITGGGRGIGQAIAQLFVEQGAHVIVTDILAPEGQAVASALRADFFPLDVSNLADWDALDDWLKNRYGGGLDVLVNNAGVSGMDAGWGPQDPEHTDLEEWRRIQQINTESVFLGCRYAIAWMKRKGGSIVNIASRSGLVGVPFACAYAASKAAVRNHTKSVALYCAQQRYGIRCNAIHPAAIMTPIWEPMLGEMPETREAFLSRMEQDIPLGRMGDPQDVAYAALYFASDESQFVTGSELCVDGGIMAGTTASVRPSVRQSDASFSLCDIESTD